MRRHSAFSQNIKEHLMDKDRIEGIARQVKGNIKEGIGKITGDAKMEAEGKADKNVGKLQNAAGGLKDTARDALKKSA
jgi:uncharacterized protein YjbJ (UPF0337 family)